MLSFNKFLPPSNSPLRARVIFSFLCISLSKACITFATARLDTCTRLANFSSNSSLSHVDNCTKNDVVTSLSSKNKNVS